MPTFSINLNGKKFDYVLGYPQWLERRACLSLAYATLYPNSSGICPVRVNTEKV